MQKNVYKIIIVVVVALVVLGGGYWYYQNNEDVDFNIFSTKIENTESKPLAATLAYQQGNVLVKVADGDWQTVETDAVLHEGDSISTGEESDIKAIIELENGDIIRLGYNTEIFFTSLKTDAVKISQVSGASYHRVSKDRSEVYEVETPELTTQAMGTAFDVVMGDDKIEVGVVESKVRLITSESNEELKEGEIAEVNITDKDISIGVLGEEKLKNNWYTWNKEEDSKKTDKLGVLSDYAGPAINISSPKEGEVTENNKINIEGTVSDFEAKIYINGEEVENNAGQYSKEVSLNVGKNVIIVSAEDANGYKSLKEIKIYYQTTSTNATPITLTAETKTDGVYLRWNKATGENFQYYKVVRSETNESLKYPDDGYIAVNGIGQESYIDTDVSADKIYYYRVCEVYSGDKVFCSNVAHMLGKQQIEQEQEQEQNNDTQNQEQNQNQNENRVGIFLSGEGQSDGIHLTWSVEGMEISNGFKLIMGESINPVYPGNDAKLISENNATSYTWALTNGQTYHFRVCQYNGEGACLVYSNNISVKAYQPADTSVNLIMSAKAENTGVGLWWTAVADDVAGFKYYKVVRSETNSDLRYPDDGYISVQSKGSESYRDFSSVKGKPYYYRICAVGDSIYCGNVIQITPVHENPAPSAVILSATYSDGKVSLSWTQSGEPDFKYYKIAWSQTVVTPTYPIDGYIKAESTKEKLTFTDEGDKVGTRGSEVDLSTGTHYYSVCVVDSQDKVACSNVKTLVNGVIQ